MIGTLLVIAGAVLVVVGLRLATGRPRPVDLAGGLLAALGLCVALLGAERLVSKPGAAEQHLRR